MTIRILAIVVLVLLVTTVLLGIRAVLVWRRHRAAGYPTAKIATHITLQSAGILCWIAFIVTTHAALAWAALILLTVGQVFGDLLMFASYRARHSARPKPGYGAVAQDVLGFSRPVPALHAIVGALAWFGMLGITIATLFV